MAIRRDYIDEILQRRSRQLKRVQRNEQMKRRMGLLIVTCDAVRRDRSFSSPMRGELFRHFPVATVATIEGYFRMLCRDLIDRGPPFVARAAKLKDVAVSLDSIAAISSRKATIGEIIAHQLRHSRRDHIHQALSVLLDQDFNAEFQKRLDSEDPIFPLRLLQLVDWLYDQRHIYCHEIAALTRPKLYAIETAVKMAAVYLILLEEHVSPMLSRRQSFES
jgi:hypothetical protein